MLHKVLDGQSDFLFFYKLFKPAYAILLLLANAQEPRHEISKNVICATSKASDEPAHKLSLIRTFASR